MQIPLINEHLFCKYFVSLSVGNATKGFATYGCCHPCITIKLLKKNNVIHLNLYLFVHNLTNSKSFAFKKIRLETPSD